MATAYQSPGGVPRGTASASPVPQWYEQPKTTAAQSGGEIRSVTPAMNNTRGANYPSRVPSPQPYRSGTPQRYYGAYSAQDNTTQQQQQQQQQSKGPSSTGLIRLTLRKPMGIVFEPMYDPNQPSVQRGVRICDLPRTGAAALSRQLEVGDELLSINDKTMSRLTFDEIMDFIIEADPEQVNLLFRRPRRETLAARNAPKATSNNSASVKWVDDDARKKKPQQQKESRKRSKKDDDDTLETAESRGGGTPAANSREKRKSRRSKHYHESESFLDLLIDTICANPDAVCKSSDRRRQGDDDFDSDEEDDRTFNSQDDSTYVTYESDAKDGKSDNKKSRGHEEEESFDETEEDTVSEDERKRLKKELVKKKEPSKAKPKSSKKYEDDYKLETLETKEHEKEPASSPVANTPLGLAPTATPPAPPVLPHVPDEDEGTNSNPAPIKEVEYDDQIDHGADVSVMESLGGPSLLIEKQRQAAAAAKNPVPADILKNFGADYPADFGLTREETILKNPIKFYTHVVKGLLEEHEPEKVRLLEKLLAKYKGREDHLVQKLSVRYNKTEDNPTIPEEATPNVAGSNFTEAVNRNKESEDAARNVEKAQERAAATFGAWPEKETKEQEPEDTQEPGAEESQSESASEYSGDSIDGTSPAVIAQVSELLNYVYGKTSVPGQIDRVSTIMRAYEGREAVLLELLETKALIKANSEKENAANLPSFLRNSPALQHAVAEEEAPQPNSVLSPMGNQQTVGGNMINDDISSMSGVSSPQDNPGATANKTESADASAPTRAAASPARQPAKTSAPQKVAKKPQSVNVKATSSITKAETKTPEREKKKKKGLFGGLFGKKNKNKSKSTQSKG